MKPIEKLNEGELRYLLKYSEYKKVRDKASKVYPWEKAGKDALYDYMIYYYMQRMKRCENLQRYFEKRMKI